MTAVATLGLVGVMPASAGPTCSDVEFLGISVHGQHVVRDYVSGSAVAEWPPKGVGAAIGGTGAALPGGPGPGYHFPNEVAPGASFCNSQANSPGFHVGD
jgi:hypothetical protein